MRKCATRTACGVATVVRANGKREEVRDRVVQATWDQAVGSGSPATPGRSARARLQEPLLRLARERGTCSQNSGDPGEAGAQGMGRLPVGVACQHFQSPHSFCPSLAEFVVDLLVLRFLVEHLLMATV